MGLRIVETEVATCSIGDLRTLLSPHMRAKKPRNHAVLEMRGFLRRLSLFRAELEQKRIVKHWLTVQELVAQVKDSVNDMVRRKPAVGWIRGDQAFDPEVYRERDELRRDNEMLKEKIANELAISDDVSHGKDPIEILFDIKVYSPGKGPREGVKAKWISTWDDIVNLVIDQLYLSDGEDNIRITISSFAFDNYKKSEDFHALGISEDTYLSSELSAGVIQQIRFQFEAVGLITAVSSDYRDVFGESRRGICWQLTDKGRKYISRSHAVRKPEST